MKPDEFGFPVCVGATGNPSKTPIIPFSKEDNDISLYGFQTDKVTARAKKAAAQEWQQSILKWNQKHQDAGLCLGFVFGVNIPQHRNFAFVFGKLENGLLQRPYKILDRRAIARIPDYQSLGAEVINHVLEVAPDTCPSLPRLIPAPIQKGDADGRSLRRSY